MLRIDALLVLTLGAFDETGQYAYEPQYDGDAVEPVTVFGQAITMMGDATTFATSGVIVIEFDGVGGLITRPLSMVGAPAWVTPAQRAIRRGILA